MKRFWSLFALSLLLASCDLSMKNQPRDDRMGSSALWKGGPQRALPPAGTLSQANLASEQALANAPALTPELLARGQERYQIYCSVCHGDRGDGDGMVVQHGFPPPPSYHIPRLLAAPPRHFVDVITNGYGVMYSYGDRVAPRDRWAIAAYIKILQAAGPGKGAQ